MAEMVEKSLKDIHKQTNIVMDELEAVFYIKRLKEDYFRDVVCGIDIIDVFKYFYEPMYPENRCPECGFNMDDGEEVIGG